MIDSSERRHAPGDDLGLIGQTESMDPSSQTPHQRLLELASILARAVARLRKYRFIAAASDSPESSRIGLEAVATTRPYGSRRQPETTPEE